MARSLLSASDLSAEEVLGLFRRAEEAAGDPLSLSRRLGGRVVVGLFWQPAPRLEATLRAACARAGAAYLSGGELLPGFPSADLADAAVVAGAYGDLLVVRHPLEGAARVAAERAGVPVANAGDGCREDPLRALLALRSLVARRGEDVPRAAAVCGDLRRNRLAHSLASALASLGTTVLLVPSPGAEMPDHLVAGLARRLHRQPVRCEAQSLRTILDMVDTVALTPAEGYQNPLFAGHFAGDEEERRQVRTLVGDMDAVFVAAQRAEDGGSAGVPADPADEEGHPWLRDEGRLVLRPFGRGAAPPERAASLRDEAAREVPLAAELLSYLLSTPPPGDPPDTTGAPEGMRCGNARCIVRRDRGVAPAFEVIRRDPLVLECVRCGVPARPRFAGSRLERRYHAVASQEVRKIHAANVVYFAAWAEAEEAGFSAARTSGGGRAADPEGTPAPEGE